MCGISGILDLRGRTVAPALVRDMNVAQAHRGPDGDGVLELGPLVLGHRRLAIIDLSPGGAQPMQLADEGLAISYNGEVYNYVELRDELRQAGVRFESESDTEVVLRAYAQWGEEAFARFNGMWALALWDARKKRLVLSRDRFGIKPLYLFEARDRLLFASEAKAILVAAPAARAVDRGVLGRFLQGGVQDDGPRTFFAGVRQLRPGTWCSFELRGDAPPSRTEGRYWTFSAAEARERYDYRDPAATLRGLLDEAVALRLRSDVPVGTCLSGGLDSSTVVALAAGHSKQPVRTFTAVHADRGYDERRYAREVVARFGCQPAEIEPRIGRDLVPLLDLLGWYHDEPCARPGLITQWFVMSLAAGEVTVLLDGQGGDELLLGYVHYALPYLRSLWSEANRLPEYRQRLKFWRDGIGLLLQPSTTPEGPGRLLGHLARIGLRRLRPGQRDPELSPELRAAAAQVALERTPRDPGRSRVDLLMQDELCYSSIPALLHHEDRTSMAFSLEARVPFLDHRVVEMSLGMDYREKVRGGLMKSVLRRAMRDVLPRSVVERTDKLGYPTPIARWLRDAGDEVKELLLCGFAERGYVPPAAVERTWLEVERGRGNPWLVYRWLTTELWQQRFLDRPPAPPLPLERGVALPVPAQPPELLQPACVESDAGAAE